MAGYPKAILRDICDAVEYGYTASSSTEPIGPRFLRITDIVPDRLDWDRVPYCEIEPKRLAKHQLRSGDIVIARTGATTGWAKYIANPPKAVFASYLVRIQPAKSVDSRYIGFVVESQVYKDFVQQHMGGAAQPNANAQILSSFELPLPPLPIQRRISGILSAYDDLIENSQRRIKILEEMARALYREWFVNFRYPGHESVPLVWSPVGEIPQGWEVKTVEEIVKRISVGKRYDQKTVSSTGAVPVFDQGKSGIIGYHDDEPGVIASEAAPVIVFANHTCYQRLVHIPFSAIQNVLPFVPNPANARDIYWLHWATNGLVVFNDYKGHWPEFAAQRLTVPLPALCQQFGDFAAPLSRQILKLDGEIQNLRRTRDLLLPRLLSGQIDVEAMAA